MGKNRASSARLLSEQLLEQMAETLEVTDQEAVAKLGERVEAALQEYRTHLDFPRPPTKKLHESFERLSRLTVELVGEFRRLGPIERQEVDRALEEFLLLRGESARTPGVEESIFGLKRILTTLRVTKGSLPRSRKGRPKEKQRWYFVHRLAMIYARSRPRVIVDGEERFEVPTRVHDPVEGQDTGRFRDFVFLAIEALGDLDDGSGIDHVIRSVCATMAKKRRQKT
jgi:hypothetical protein